MFGKLFKRTKQGPLPAGEDELQPLYDLIRNILDGPEKQLPLAPATVLEEIGFDSIKYIHLLLSLEDLLQVELETVMAEIDITAIKTIQDLGDLVRKYQEK